MGSDLFIANALNCTEEAKIISNNYQKSKSNKITNNKDSEEYKEYRRKRNYMSRKRGDVKSNEVCDKDLVTSYLRNNKIKRYTQEW